MSNSSITTPKLAAVEPTTTTASSRTTAGRVAASTGGKGRSRASSQSVFWEN